MAPVQCSRKNATETALAGVGGFELSDPEEPPLEHGLTATEGRSARQIHCRMDWTGVQVTLWQLSREKSLIAKRCEMKGNSGHTSKANFESGICEFESSHPRLAEPACRAERRHEAWRLRNRVYGRSPMLCSCSGSGPTGPKRGTLQISSRTRRTRAFSVVVVSVD